ncbi:hypothetical protein ACWD5R_18680 [Streptomyces sp. NPDC002514]|uniref:hypothetical protein n=1 Tax=Streptomyces sp. NPDC001270 TaxID=3364554 RepID=UPI0036BA1932
MSNEEIFVDEVGGTTAIPVLLGAGVRAAVIPGLRRTRAPGRPLSTPGPGFDVPVGAMLGAVRGPLPGGVLAGPARKATLALWDRATGKPVHDAAVRQDTRRSGSPPCGSPA